MTKEKIKNIAYSVGKLIGIFGLIYVFYKLFQAYTLHDLIEKFSEIKSIFLPLIILNLASLMTGIYAWKMMLTQYSGHRLPYFSAYYFFSKTEIAKYLPGNVFHLVGRQAIASKLHISQKQMGKVSFLHILLLLVSTILSATFFSVFTPDIPYFIKLLLLLGSIISIVLVYFIYPSFPFSKKMILSAILAFSIALQGVLLAWIVVHLTGQASWQLFCELSAIYIISWLIGFVTPGSSGGLGVREGAFVAIIAFLKLDIPSDIIVFSVLLVRLINIIVDALMYLSTYMLETKIKGSHL